MSTLKLTLKKQWFDLMLCGEKLSEFRVPGRWIKSRLLKNGFARDYEDVEFVNGYGQTKPRFKRKYLGYVYQESVDEEYSDGSRVVGGPFYEILLGDLC